MLFQSLLLFLVTLLGGTVVFFVRRPSQAMFQLLLVLSGGYLFGITILHLLPELFALHGSSQRIGLYILLGFFLQLLLELMSKGIEHGHMDTPEGPLHKTRPVILLLALCIHAFLDGAILSSPTMASLHQHTHGSEGLLIGVLLHKLPVAFAFASVLNARISSKYTVVRYMTIFALASPLGLWATHYCSHHFAGSSEGLIALWGIVSGSFLHIATTIFFEASPGHHLNARKFLASLAGASLAVVFEFLL